MSECDHPECESEPFAGAINGVKVCAKHIEWAMTLAFAPIHRLEEILKDGERRDITRGIAGLPLTDLGCDVAEAAAAKILADFFTAPVESEIANCADCDEPSETVWEDGTRLCYACAYGRAGWE
jgi:hypothetical protein